MTALERTLPVSRDLQGARLVTPLGWTLFLFALPATTGLVARFWKHGLWFTDFRAVVCGAQRASAGVGLYDQSIACADPKAAAFVYAPWVAKSAAALMALLGSTGFAFAYGLVFVAAMAAMVWAAQLREGTPGDAIARARFLGFVPGGAPAAGNIAVPIHGAVGLAALAFERAPWLFVAVVAAAAAIKPVFLTYLAVVLLARRPWRWRLGAAAAGTVAGLAPTLAFVAAGGPEAAAWRGLLGHFVYDVTPGTGLFGWLAWLGQSASGPSGAMAALAWAGLVTLGGLALAERADLAPTSRTWLGLTCGVLANPRLMGEDLFLVGPGVLAAAAAISAWNPRLGRLAFGAATAACILAMTGRVLDFADIAAPISTLVLAAILLGCAGYSLRREPTTARS